MEGKQRILVVDDENDICEVIKLNLELKGYAVFSVSVENDEKVFAVTPDGAMKALIKDDSALEDCE